MHVKYLPTHKKQSYAQMLVKITMQPVNERVIKILNVKSAAIDLWVTQGDASYGNDRWLCLRN